MKISTDYKLRFIAIYILTSSVPLNKQRTLHHDEECDGPALLSPSPFYFLHDRIKHRKKKKKKNSIQYLNPVIPERILQYFSSPN